jgi:hypothetical protein
MKKSDDGDFTDKTRRTLAARAGHHCSLCLALTTCSDAEGKPFPIGDAAHQAAASAGGPRYDPQQSKTERSSPDNGLWLCSSCHRKIDGDKYRYTVEDLKEMKKEAEERARRMVHGEIVFEMKDKEQAAIEYYLNSRPLENQLPRSASGETLAQGGYVASGAILGVQKIIPYSAITDRPRLGYPELISAGVPTSRRDSPPPNSDDKGVFAEIGEEVSRIDRDATAQIWINYPGMNPGAQERAVPGAKIAGDVIRYLQRARAVFAKHGIRSPRVIVRARLENVLDKILFHGNSEGVQLRKPIVPTSYVMIDQGEESKILEELWYCAGWPHGLPQRILNVIQEVLAESSR